MYVCIYIYLQMDFCRLVPVVPACLLQIDCRCMNIVIVIAIETHPKMKNAITVHVIAGATTLSCSSIQPRMNTRDDVDEATATYSYISPWQQLCAMKISFESLTFKLFCGVERCHSTRLFDKDVHTMVSPTSDGGQVPRSSQC